MSQKVLLRKIVKVPGRPVPRIHLYYTKPTKERNMIAGVDYEGYLILEADSDRPYFICDNRREYLTALEILEIKHMFKTFRKKPEKKERKHEATFAQFLFI